MQTLVIGICDDDHSIHQEIQEICSNCLMEAELIYKKFYAGEEVLEFCNQGEEEIDLLFLDVQMEGISGILLKDKLLNNQKVKKIAFVSSYVESVYDSFSKKTIGFIPKPIDANKIEKLLCSTIEELKFYQTLTFTHETGEMVNIQIQDIQYLKADGSYTYVYVSEKDDYYILSERLGEIEKRLPEELFVRVHKSYVVNLEYVKSFKTIIELRERKEEIPVGRTYQKSAKTRFYNYGKQQVLRRV